MTSRPSHVRHLTRRLTVLTVLGVLAPTLAGVLALAPSATAANRTTAAAPRQVSIELPPNWQPEGIAAHGSRLYVGSLSTGGIFTTEATGPNGRVLSQGGPNRALTGLKVAGNRIYAAGAAGGVAYVFNRRTGADVGSPIVLANGVSTNNPSFINDVVVRRGSALFTDSSRQVLYQVSRRTLRATTLRITGDLQYTPDRDDFDGNGIVSAGPGAIMGQSTTGDLFTVTIQRNRAVTRKITLSGAATSLPTNDGLLREGRTLYVVQNQPARIAVVRLSRDLTRGRVTSFITNQDQPRNAQFVVPATIARAAGSLWVVNAKFGVANPEPYTVVQVTSHRTAQTGQAQVGSVPQGGVPSGGGSTAGFQNLGLLGTGGALILLSGATLVVRRRQVS